MAAILFRHVSRSSNLQFPIILETTRFVSSNRVKPKKLKRVPQKEPTGLESVYNSLSNRGYLRAYKNYEPKQNVDQEIIHLAADFKINKNSTMTVTQKFELLSKCHEIFNHSVPNSQLHAINSLDDVINFYETPVDTKRPLDVVQSMELPENLHIQSEYVRFHPESDTKFGGISAFPKSSTMVTGLKYKEKYAGYVAKKSWP